MSQLWLPLERSEPDLRLWSLNVVALLHREVKKRWSLGEFDLGGAWINTRPDVFWRVGSTIDEANAPFHVVCS